MTMLIDTHCHLNDPSFESSLSDVIARAREAGVRAAIVPAYDAPSLERTAEIALQLPDFVFPAYGVHPWFVQEGTDLDQVRAFLERKDVVAVGEIGLDLSPDKPDIRLQQRMLTLQLDCAVELGLPVLIHCRKAYDALYSLVTTYRGRVTGVLHSFSGTTEMMEKFLDLGFYIAFSGAVTRTTAKKYHRNAKAVPADRLLLETDSPSIATETTVASKVEPRHVAEVATKVADLRGILLNEVCRQSSENARRLFHLKKP
jgi:TatD DNase family protein